MTLVEVIGLDVEAERVQDPHAADAEDDLLLETVGFVIALFSMLINLKLPWRLSKICLLFHRFFFWDLLHHLYQNITSLLIYVTRCYPSI
mgnify:CR=1 FL=1